MTKARATLTFPPEFSSIFPVLLFTQLILDFVLVLAIKIANRKQSPHLLWPRVGEKQRGFCHISMGEIPLPCLLRFWVFPFWRCA